MDVRTVRLEELHEDPNNARRHGERNLAAISASLKSFGQVEALVVQKGTGRVIGGNGRLQVMRKEGVTECQIVEVELDDTRAAALGIALNRAASLAEWDTQTLVSRLELLSAEGFAIEDAGFSLEDLTDLKRHLPAGEVVQDEPPPVPDEPKTKRGDLYEFGAHRLLAGDSTNPEDVARVMDGQRAILFATDPPYLVNYDGTNHPHKWNEADKNKDWSGTYGVTWDEATGNDELYDKFIAVAVSLAIQPNAAWYCWHASRRQSMLEGAWERHGAFVHQQIIWAKDRPILTRSWYMWRHEPCFFGWVRPNKPPRRTDDYPHSVWEIPTVKCGEKTDHPTSKPVEVFAIPMRQHTMAGDVCYEPFAGSGSQIISAEYLGRRCFALEIEPRYVDVSVRRWQRLTGGKVIRNGQDVTYEFAEDQPQAVAAVSSALVSSGTGGAPEPQTL